ncbi:polysaccharide biosynthesis C-terminal domain-containing protein [Sphingobacterium rhinopitheci]|uniref:polysaccharide biosynthesis C-terminal domain-containing protein n=1 Tax=Sphingobacterium rhinopitheci TaxID=2781960 RepID=UPI001F51E645|nr:polysaccharide biosynthesis C-terminal domain-containing protein [Sphingobacterium rhinopitheci]
MSKIKKLISDTIIYGFTTVVTRMIGFVMTPIYTRSFTNTSVYGVFTNVYSYAALINALLAFGMETTYFRYLNKVDPQDKSKVANNSFVVTLFTTILFLVTVFLFLDPIALWLAQGEATTDLSEYISFVKYFAVILSADALSVVPFVKLRAEGRPIRYSFVKLVNIFVLVFTNLFLLFWLPSLIERYQFWSHFAAGWFREGWLGNVFIANLIASLVTLILLVPQLLKFRLSVDKKLMKAMLAYSLPIFVANISFIINEHLDKMMFPRLIPGKVGEMELGIYGAVAKLAVFLNLFVTAFRLGVEPFFFSNAKDKNAGKTYAMIMDYFIIIMVVVMVGISANIDWLKYFIAGKGVNQDAYWAGLYILPVLLLNNVLLGIYMNLTVWYKLSDQTRYALYISGIGAILTIIFNLLFIPSYSYVGAALSTTAAYLVMVLLSFIWGQKNYPIPYHVAKNLSYLFVGVIISGLIFYVFDMNAWIGNALFIAFLVLVFYKEKNEVMRILKRQ